MNPRRHVLIPAMFLAFSVCASCGPRLVDTRSGGFSRSCQSDRDCRLVSSGCDVNCSCANEPISRLEVERFIDWKKDECGFQIPSGPECICRAFEAQCIESQCEILDCDDGDPENCVPVD